MENRLFGESLPMQHVGKLVCSTLVYRDLDVFRAMELIAAEGFVLLELCTVPGFCPHFDLAKFSVQDAEQLKARADALGLTIVSINVNVGSLTGPSRKQTLGLVEKCIDLAIVLGARIIILPSGRRVSATEWDHSVKELNASIRPVADLAAEHSIAVAIETPHVNTIAETVEEAHRLLEQIDHRVKCAFDTSHAFRGERIALADAVKVIGTDRIGHIHLRDVRGEELTFSPGKGHGDFRGLFRALSEIGYSGYLCIELEFDDLTVRQRSQELRFSRQYIERVMQGRTLPLALRFKTLGIYLFAERLLRNPKAEVKRHPQIIGVYRAVRPYLLPLLPVRAYDGHWRNIRYPSRNKLIVQPPGSVRLSLSPDRLIRVCIQGCGYAGTMHAFGFQRLAGVKVVGVCDVDADKARRLAQQVGCVAYCDFGRMLETEKPDLVSVCTREWQHYDAVIESLRSGADVFCEKILATRWEQAQEIVETAKTLGRTVGVNYNYRFMPSIRKLWEIVQHRALGDLRLLEIRVNGLSYHHALDLVYYLGGRVSEVWAQYTRDEDGVRSFGMNMDWGQFDDDILYGPGRSLVASFRLESGAIANVTSSCLYPGWAFILSIDAVFEGGFAAISGINTNSVVGTLTTNPTVRTIDMNYKRGVFAKGYEYTFSRSIESFVNAYILGAEPETSAAHGLYIVKLERAIYESNRHGKKVLLAEHDGNSQSN